MNVRFASKSLARLEVDEGYDAGHSNEIVDLFRRRMQFIRAAADERDFYALKSLHYEKLKGSRKHQRSMRLNNQFRLILEVRKESSKIIVIVNIEDYH
jgi:proteic killer suppression protein